MKLVCILVLYNILCCLLAPRSPFEAISACNRFRGFFKGDEKSFLKLACIAGGISALKMLYRADQKNGGGSAKRMRTSSWRKPPKPGILIPPARRLAPCEKQTNIENFVDELRDPVESILDIRRSFKLDTHMTRGKAIGFVITGYSNF